MAVNLLDLVSRSITPDAVQGISKFLGESDSAVQSGIGTLVPALLAGMASKASTPSGASSLFALINGPAVNANLMDNVGETLGAGQSSSLLQLGGRLLGGLFGSDKAPSVSSALTGITGMKPSGAGNLLMVAVPMLFSVLKRLIGEKGLDARGLASLLAGQKDFLAGKLDPRLTSAFGLGSPSSLLAGLGETATGTAGRAAAAVGAAGATAGAAATAGASGVRRWLPWLIGGGVALFLLTLLPQCGTEVDRRAAPVAASPAPATTPAPATVQTAPAATASPTVADLSAKVYFDTGKAELRADGDAVVKSVAAKLAANRSAKVAVTGYTDKTGNAAANEELAKKRALEVKAALEAAGVAPDQVDTKPPMFVEAGAGGADAEARRVEIVASK